ncbi:MAG TPA: PEP-CTERM sorting domain-containing protein [Bryobacteraceae bacterium]|jgi:hypothetical protein|nr:PEP-CTERM sorting domain-containing protein [Bryobacteraceae bacterium]
MIGFRFAAKAVVFFAACTLPVFGDAVDFTTTGVFDCGAAIGCSTSNGGSTVTISNSGNTLTMTATGFTYGPGNGILPSNPDSDQVNIITFNTSAHSSPGVNTSGLGFTLDIDQTVPAGSPNSGSLLGSFSGRIDASGSNTTVSFAPDQTSLTLGGNITYTLNFLDPSNSVWTIPNSGLSPSFGQTTETATITPEPTFMMLSGLGFVGLGFAAYRRKRTV